MTREYATHWALGLLCALIWFWGDRAGIPSAAVALAGSIVPGLLGHALAYTSDTAPNVSAPQSGAQSATSTQP